MKIRKNNESPRKVNTKFPSRLTNGIIITRVRPDRIQHIRRNVRITTHVIRFCFPL